MPSIKNFFFINLEILAAFATLFAAYEFLIARRHVPILTTIGVDCSKSLPTESIRHFLTDHVEQLVFVDLDMVLLEQCNSEIDPDDFEPGVAWVGHDTRYVDGNYELTSKSKNLGYDFGQMQTWNGYLLYDASLFDGQILARVDTAEDRMEERIQGLVFLTDKAGEGDSYFTLIPAPYENRTVELQACTKSLLGKAGITWLFSYFASCIF